MFSFLTNVCSQTTDTNSIAKKKKNKKKNIDINWLPIVLIYI